MILLEFSSLREEVLNNGEEARIEIIIEISNQELNRLKQINLI